VDIPPHHVTTSKVDHKHAEMSTDEVDDFIILCGACATKIIMLLSRVQTLGALFDYLRISLNPERKCSLQTNVICP